MSGLSRGLFRFRVSERLSKAINRHNSQMKVSTTVKLVKCPEPNLLDDQTWILVGNVWIKVRNPEERRLNSEKPICLR